MECSLWILIRDSLCPPDVMRLRTAERRWNNAQFFGEFAALWFFLMTPSAVQGNGHDQELEVRNRIRTHYRIITAYSACCQVSEELSSVLTAVGRLFACLGALGIWAAPASAQHCRRRAKGECWTFVFSGACVGGEGRGGRGFCDVSVTFFHSLPVTGPISLVRHVPARDERVRHMFHILV